MNAKNMLLDKYPDAKIEIIDATVNTVLQGMLVEEAVAKKNTGATFEETVKLIICSTIFCLDFLRPLVNPLLKISPSLSKINGLIPKAPAAIPDNFPININFKYSVL